MQFESSVAAADAMGIRRRFSFAQFEPPTGGQYVIPPVHEVSEAQTKVGYVP
jgi:hypothetical protein